MAKIYRPLITPEYSTVLANELRNYSDASCYLTIGKWDQWSTNENAVDFTPPLPINTNNYKHQFWDNIIGYIRIAKENTRLVIDRVDWIKGTSYKTGDVVVVYNSTVDGNDTYPDALDGFMMYRCIQNPSIEGNGVCSNILYLDQDSCELAGESWTPTPAQNIPTGFGAAIDTLDGYLWEYLYTIPPAEISEFCTNEYVVVPSEEELINNLSYWSRDLVSSTIFDHGRMCYSIGAHKLMLRTILADNYFRNMLIEEYAYRQIGVVLKPYEFNLAPPCGDASPWYGVNGACSLFGWKILANPATRATYEAYEILANSGELLYMENRAPIYRSFNETNDIRIILGF